MKPRSAADNQMPPPPGGKVELASYTAVPGKLEPAPGGDKDAEIARLRGEITRLLGKMRPARDLVLQGIAYLQTDAYGNQREPSYNEREAIEVFHRIYQELAP